MELRDGLHLFSLVAMIALAAVLLRWKDRGGRVSLQTLLLITTLVAVMLGAIVADVQLGAK